MPERKPILVYENPAVKEAVNAAKAAISEMKALIIAGNCWVDYHGRASSRLEPGERILMIKQDGSVLVHRSKGYEPVNWQPSGCIFHTYTEKGALVVKAIRQKPHEAITVHFDRIYLLAALNLVDNGGFYLYASEADMQRAIVIQPSIVEDGLRIITYEKKTEPGFIDVYGIDKNGKMVVIEIKRKAAGKSAALQLAKYIDALKVTAGREVRGILAAPELSKGVQKLLVTLGLSFKPLDPKKCTEIIREIETKKLADYF